MKALREVLDNPIEVGTGLGPVYPFVGPQLFSLREARSSRFGLIWELQDGEPVWAGCDVDAILWPSASAAKLGSQLNHLLKTAEIHPKECGLLDLASRKVRCVALLLRRAAATR